MTAALTAALNFFPKSRRSPIVPIEFQSSPKIQASAPSEPIGIAAIFRLVRFRCLVNMFSRRFEFDLLAGYTDLRLTTGNRQTLVNA